MSAALFDPLALDRLAELRGRLFAAIEQTLSVEGHCKSYEGTFSIILPSYFERHEDDERWAVQLDLYVIGPSRHYSWTAPSLRGAVIRAEREVSKWLADHDKWWEAEGSSLVTTQP